MCELKSLKCMFSFERYVHYTDRSNEDNFIKLRGLGRGIKVNYLHGSQFRGCSSWETFSGIAARIYTSFGEKPQKTPNGLVNKRDRGSNPAPFVFQFEHRSAQPLVGLIFCRITKKKHIRNPEVPIK